jgi:hypothetical protein
MPPLSIYPEPTLSSLTASGFTVPSPTLNYQVSGTTFPTGVYTITTFPTTSQATVSFNNPDGSNFVTTTVSGTVTVNVSFDSTNTYIYTDTGTNIVVTINNTAQSLSGVSLSGTLDTVTTTSTYNQTGKLLVVAIAGGGGGGSGGATTASGWTNDEYGGGNGGRSGTWAIFGPGFVNTSQTVTIGAGGAKQPALTGAPTGTQEGSQGGTTSFGNLAVANNANVNLNVGQGGFTPPQSSNTSGPTASVPLYRNISNGTTGGGGFGAQSGSGGSDNTQGGYGGRGPAAGAGSGIGTGGTGAANFNVAATAPTGFGSGGGGGYGRTSRYNGSAGTDGRPGVVYVLRGF